MGLFSKVKNILFDEDVDLTEQIKITPEMRSEEIPQKPVVKETPAPAPIKREEPVQNRAVNPEFIRETPRERPIEKTNYNNNYNNDSYPFLDFDAEEFDKQKTVVNKPPVKETPVQPKRQLNVLEIERKKRIEKRTDFGRYEKTEVTEVAERRKFHPSPIISPVYGILNQDYNKDDIRQRKNPDKVNINEVRNKAFGSSNPSEVVKKAEVQQYKREDLPKRESIPRIEEMPKMEELPRREVKPTYYEERETISITKPQEKRVKAIDELLEDTSDVMIDMREELEEELGNVDLDYITNDEKDNTKEMVVPDVDDTLESDLFDLIDSMYDTKEDE